MRPKPLPSHGPPGGEGAISFYCPLRPSHFRCGLYRLRRQYREYGYRFDREGNVSAISGGQAGTSLWPPESAAVPFPSGGKTVRLISALTVSAARRVPYPCPKPPVHVGPYPDRHLRRTAAHSRCTYRWHWLHGSMAELSHALTPDDEFSQHCRNRTLLLIDPAGKAGSRTARHDSREMLPAGPHARKDRIS